MNAPVYIGRFVVCLVSLGFGSVQDFSTREVSNWVWVVSVPICLFLDGLDMYLGNIPVSTLLASLGVSLLVGISLFYFGFFGGADAKALLLIAAAFPSYVYMPGLLLARVLFLPLVFVFFTATVLSAFYPLSILLLNLSDLRRGRHLLEGVEVGHWFGKLILYATVRKVSLERLHKSLKYLPAEKVVLQDGKPVRRPVYFVGAEADVDGLVKELEAQGDLFREGILASPTIPMVVFLAVGFVSANVVAVLSFV
jgi:preflagellin peptidase FlaK